MVSGEILEKVDLSGKKFNSYGIEGKGLTNNGNGTARHRRATEEQGDEEISYGDALLRKGMERSSFDTKRNGVA